MTDIPATRDPGRPSVSSRRAGSLIRRDPRTIRNMVRNGELAGGCEPNGTWFIYTDQPPFLAPAAPNLTDENARLRARAEAAEESNRVLLTTQAALLSALTEYQQGTENLRQALDSEREQSRLYHEAAQSYRRSSDSLSAAVNGFRDLAAANAIPDDLSEMTPPPSVM